MKRLLLKNVDIKISKNNSKKKWKNPITREE